MFRNRRALEARRRYQEIFDGAFTIDGLDTDDESAAGPTRHVRRPVCTSLGQRITCVDGPIEHDFDRTPAISLFVECGDDGELERLFVALAKHGEIFMPLDDDGFNRRDGSVQDRFGVPWQRNLRSPSRPDRRRARMVADRTLAAIFGRKEKALTDYRGPVSGRRVLGGAVHKLPVDLRAALIANPTALDAWHDITPLARNEFICWVEDAKQDMTRQRRIRRTQEELEEGQRRPCCWPGCKHRERTGR